MCIVMIHLCAIFVNNGTIMVLTKLKTGTIVMSSREIVKFLLFKRYMTITELAEKLTEKTGKKYTRQSLSKKISRSSLNYDEVEQILKILQFKIEIIDLIEDK